MRWAFCRYADDCNVYVGSRVAGKRVTCGIWTYLEEVLRLRINPAKSAVARPNTFFTHMGLASLVDIRQRPRREING